MHAVEQEKRDGWDAAFDAVEVEGRGLPRPVNKLSPRQLEYNAHIKRNFPVKVPADGVA